MVIDPLRGACRDAAVRALLRAMSSPAAVPQPHEIRDFPDWVPAMVVKELRQGLRARMFAVPFLLVQILATLALVQEYFAYEADAAVRSFRLTGDAVLPGAFWMGTWIMIGVVMPFRCMGSLSAETRERNADLLLLGGLSRMGIVRGKWLVQLLLSLLTLLSLAPHMLARYFLGSVDLTETLLHFLSVLGCACGMSGCVIGASGYQGTGMRLWTIGICGFWLLIASSMASVAASGLRYLVGGSKVAFLWGLYFYAYGLGAMLLYGLLGIRLARAHLRKSTLFWEHSATHGSATLLFTAPFILLCGAIVTCGAGAIFILIIMIIWAWVQGANDQPAPPPWAVTQASLRW